MAQAPAPPWWLNCAWCGFGILVNARGMRGADPGAGVEAANAMRGHVESYHDKSWHEYLKASEVSDASE